MNSNLILKNGKPDRYLFNGGYCSYPANPVASSQPTFHYYTKDHLGNNRTVVNENGTLEQVTHYYPFGGIFGDATLNAGIQPYKYNCKEFDRVHGLNTYDYGARQYDPILLRWDRIDPLCEKYYPLNPYNYCGNSPVKYIDPDGKDPGDFFKTKIEAVKDFGLYYNPYSIRQRKEFSSFIMYNPNKKAYYYLKAIAGKSNGVSGSILLPKRHAKVAKIHTHGAFEKEYVVDGTDWNDEFSGMQSTPEENLAHSPKNRYDDISTANELGIESYVVTPNGNIKKYDPQTGKITIISREIPSDKNAGDRRVNNKDIDTTGLINQLIKAIKEIFK